MKERRLKYNNLVGVLGAGRFGLAISNLLSCNAQVLVYTRRQEVVDAINKEHLHLGIELSENIKATHNLQEIFESCYVVFPLVPSAYFRDLMKEAAPFIRPYHILIQGAKGFDFQMDEDEFETGMDISKVHTMSQVILEETSAVRIGCLSGPNLSAEINAGQPAATLIASRFQEVIDIGKLVLNSDRFHVFGSFDIIGTELAGTLKNVVAIGSGILAGVGLGKNMQGMLISRGLMEMIHIGKAIGAESKAFLGTSGIADLVTTATSDKSRNYTFGKMIGEGKTMEEILESTQMTVEGIRTLQVMKQLGIYYKVHIPITDMLYAIVFENFDIDRAIKFLIRYPYDIDVDFL